MKHNDPRPSIVGRDEGPEEPFPLRLEGPVVKGFGRGSSELGIPTANIPIEGLSVAGHTDLPTGVYFGYCSLKAAAATATATTEAAAPGEAPSEQATESKTTKALSSTPKVFQMVMSLGYNPYYKNSVRSVEVHVLHDFHGDFYGAHLKLLILGYVRDELDYVSREALIEDINLDIEVSKNSMVRKSWKRFEGEEWLRA